jgi:Transglycosylase-like domain
VRTRIALVAVFTVIIVGFITLSHTPSSPAAEAGTTNTQAQNTNSNTAATDLALQLVAFHTPATAGHRGSTLAGSLSQAAAVLAARIAPSPPAPAVVAAMTTPAVTTTTITITTSPTSITTAKAAPKPLPAPTVPPTVPTTVPAPPPTQPITDATSTDTPDWQCIRVHESGDQYNSPSAPSGAYGIVSVTWRSNGYEGWPYEAAAATQDNLALKLFHEYGWQPWSTRFACGL